MAQTVTMSQRQNVTPNTTEIPSLSPQCFPSTEQLTMLNQLTNMASHQQQQNK